MELPPSPDLCLLFVRTDYTDDAAWRQALTAATARYDVGDFPRDGAHLFVVESEGLDGLTPDEVARLPRRGYLGALAVADAQTMIDHTVLLLDLDDPGRGFLRSFRSAPEWVEGIVANLSLANMGFAEYADDAQSDGVFRGFMPPTWGPGTVDPGEVSAEAGVDDRAEEEGTGEVSTDPSLFTGPSPVRGLAGRQIWGWRDPP